MPDIIPDVPISDRFASPIMIDRFASSATIDAFMADTDAVIAEEEKEEAETKARVVAATITKHNDAKIDKLETKLDKLESQMSQMLQLMQMQAQPHSPKLLPKLSTSVSAPRRSKVSFGRRRSQTAGSPTVDPHQHRLSQL